MVAIILAGGRGERLMPLTADRPKCMIEVAGRPILAHQLAWLAGQGVERVLVSCGHRWQAISRYLEQSPTASPEVECVVEDTPLGRGGGLRKALGRLLPLSEPVVALNGDLLTDVSLADMLAEHRRAGASATLLLVPYVSQHGIVDVDATGRITGFREKPALPYYLSGGVYVLAPEVYERLPERGDHEQTTWPELAAAGRLHAYPFSGFWRSIDSPKDISEAERALRDAGNAARPDDDTSSGLPSFLSEHQVHDVIGR